MRTYLLPEELQINPSERRGGGEGEERKKQGLWRVGVWDFYRCACVSVWPFAFLSSIAFYTEKGHVRILA